MVARDKAVVLINTSENLVVDLEAQISIFEKRRKYWRKIIRAEAKADITETPKPKPRRRETIYVPARDAELEDEEDEQVPKDAIRLPRLQLPVFTGNPTDWLSFWETFETMVDRQEYAKILKVHYLMNCLRGAAEDAVKGYRAAAENYEDIKDQLKRRFGDTNILIQTLNEDLRSMRKASKMLEYVWC